MGGARRAVHETYMRAATPHVGASRLAFSGSPRRRQGSSRRFDPASGGATALTSDAVEPSEGNYVMPRDSARLRRTPIGCSRRFSMSDTSITPSIQVTIGRQTRLPRLHHYGPCRTRRTINDHALRRFAQRCRGVRRGPCVHGRGKGAHPVAPDPHRRRGARLATRSLPVASTSTRTGRPRPGWPEHPAAVALAAAATAGHGGSAGMTGLETLRGINRFTPSREIEP